MLINISSDNVKVSFFIHDTYKVNGNTMSKKNTNNFINFEQHREKVLIALEVQEKRDPGPHLTNEQIAELADGRIPEENRDDLWRHLNNCHSCYSLWLDVCRTKDDIKTSNSNIKKLFVPLLAAASIILFCFLMIPKEMEHMINQTYKAAENVQDFKLPWEERSQYFGLISPDVTKHSKRAFASGLLNARKHMLNKDIDIPNFFTPGFNNKEKDSPPWKQSKWKLFFLTGYWCYMLKAACISDTRFSDQFWEDNITIIQRLQKSYEKEKIMDDRVEKLLDKIQSELGNKAKTLKFVGYLIYYLSPEDIPDS